MNLHEPANMKTLTSLVLASSASTRERLIAKAIVHQQAVVPIQPTQPILPHQPILPLPVLAHASRSTPPATPPSTPPATFAALLEGLPDGQGQLEALLPPHQLIRIAPGCLCCSGNLVMKVSINRLLRLKPARLFIGLATTSHHLQLRALLQQAPYDQWLALGDDLGSDPDDLGNDP